MTIKELKERIKRLNAISECGLWSCVIDEEDDYLQIGHKGTDISCIWAIDYEGSLSEYLELKTMVEDLRRRTPALERRQANRLPH